jgi:glycosyltransferase involved in cell wall biosynthesis
MLKIIEFNIIKTQWNKSMKSATQISDNLVYPVTEPLVSIVIPTFNIEKYIIETIESVLAQTYGNIELIVVDDGSTDNTLDLVKSYGSKVRLIQQENSGVCIARNRGIHESTGELICLMDHDDYWFPEKIARQVEVMRHNPKIGVVFASFIRWHSDAAGEFKTPESYNVKLIPDDVDEEFSGWIYHQFLLDCWMLTSTAMFRREVFSTSGYFDVTLPYGEDWDLWLRISRNYPFIKLSRPNTLYRQHHAQGSRVQRAIDYRSMLISQAISKWGLQSRDGRSVEKKALSSKLAEYHAQYAYDHLRYGIRRIAIRSYYKAWLSRPARIKFLAYGLAAAIGWTPHR